MVLWDEKSRILFIVLDVDGRPGKTQDASRLTSLSAQFLSPSVMGEENICCTSRALSVFLKISTFRATNVSRLGSSGEPFYQPA